MELEEFKEWLDHRTVSLKTAADVVLFSFIVQKSISCLDLKLHRNARVTNYFTCDCCGWNHLREFTNVNTVEKCRKYFTPRRFLYSLHLDLPKGREYDLREKSPISADCSVVSSSEHINEILIACGLHGLILSDFIDEAMKTRTRRVKILKWILKFPFEEVPLLARLRPRTVNNFIACFKPELDPELTAEITKPDLVIQLVKQIDITGWMSEIEDNDIVHFLLSYARQYGREDLEDEEDSIEHVVATCIYERLFANIAPILKVIDFPRFDKDVYWLYRRDIASKRPSLTRKVLRKAAKLVKRKRINHMLQIIWIYVTSCEHRCSNAASETLRLLWSSFPDAYISAEEFQTAFGKVFTNEELRILYQFYALSVQEYHKYVEPRSLQHYCRVVVRRTLRERKIWIPEGLKQTGLPNELMAYLNIQH